MSNLPPLSTRRESFADGLTIRVDERGNGRPILVLHGGGGPQTVAGLASGLDKAHVLVPTHPGFAGEPRPEWFDSIDDLALAYLDLLERLDLHDVLVIGSSMGGVSTLTPDELAALSFHNPAAFRVDPATVSPEQAAARAANVRALYVYDQGQGMGDLKLRRRLRRVSVPVLVVWGESDRVIDPEYGRAYAQAFPHARFELIPEAGHLPQIEQPERLLILVRKFAINIRATPPTAGSFEER